MGAELYGRRLTLQVIAGGVSRKWVAISEGGGSSYISISFAVEQTGHSEPNKAEIVIYNLNEDGRRLLSDSGARVILSCGYRQTEGQIFAGDIDQVDVPREGGDIAVRLSCSDGGVALRSTVVNVSTSADQSVSGVVSDLLAELGLPQGVVEVAEGALKQGLSYCGPLKRVLDDLVGSAGLTWSVQDGVVQVHGVKGLPGTATKLTKSTGMVGSPRRLTQRDDVAGTDRLGVAVRSLLQPILRPGKRIRVESDILTGDFVAGKVRHSGSTFSGEWYTDVEAF